MTTRRTTAHHRPVRRVDDALDYAFDAGQYAYANELLEAQLDEARRKLAPPPRGKQVRSLLLTILIFGGSLFLFYVIGQVSAVRSMPDDQPLGTAQIAPTRRPTSPPAPAVVAPDVPAEPSVPTSDYGIPAYNATQQAITVEQASPAEEATPLPEPGDPTFVDSFQPSGCSAMITYLRGHPCYSGPPPQAVLPKPGEDGFVESFK